MAPIKIFFIVALAHLKSSVMAKEEEDILNFGICPSSHPYAFNLGRKCCSEWGTTTQWRHNHCHGEAIPCSSSSCDHTCPCFSCEGGNYLFYLFIANLSHHYDGDYVFDTWNHKYLEGNRPIFQGTDKVRGKCMWWHHKSRHWWIGPCANIGTDAGFAFIEEEIRCITDLNADENGDYFELTWRRGGSHVKISNVEFSRLHQGSLSSGGEKVNITNSYVGVNAVIQDGTRYSQNCRFVYRNGRFVCHKKSGMVQRNES